MSLFVCFFFRFPSRSSDRFSDPPNRPCQSTASPAKRNMTFSKAPPIVTQKLLCQTQFRHTSISSRIQCPCYRPACPNFQMIIFERVRINDYQMNVSTNLKKKKITIRNRNHTTASRPNSNDTTFHNACINVEGGRRSLAGCVQTLIFRPTRVFSRSFILRPFFVFPVLLFLQPPLCLRSLPSCLGDGVRASLDH